MTEEQAQKLLQILKGIDGSLFNIADKLKNKQ